MRSTDKKLFLMRSLLRKRWIVLIIAVCGVGGLIVLSAFSMRDVPDLKIRLASANAILDRARTERVISYSAVDTVLLHPEEDHTKARKVLFITKMLGMIAAENARIRDQRAILDRSPSAAHLNALALEYGLKPGRVTPAQLRQRIDTIPESLVLAQAAIESAWGTSRFAQQGNSFFGERTYDPNAAGLEPLRATGFKVKSFRTPALSVRSYMRTLNSHRAYRAFREKRAALRKQGKKASGHELAIHLGKYSELGKDYISRVLSTMRANRLSDFDGLQTVDTDL